METGADSGMWTFTRYHTWLERRTQWTKPSDMAAPPPDEHDRRELSATVPFPAPALPKTLPTAQPNTGEHPFAPTRIEISDVESDFKILHPRPE